MIKSTYHPTLPSAGSGASSSSSQPSRCFEEDENGSICCDIYIDGDEQSQMRKGGSKTPLHVAAVLRGMPAPPGPPEDDSRRRRCSSVCWWAVMVCLVAAAVAVAVGVGIGVARHRQHPPAVVLHGAGSASLQQSSVTITVPFGATARVDVPQSSTGSSSSSSLTCDTLFGDEQELERFVERLEAAHSRRMAEYQVDEVVVTELHCNNISYPVPAETFLAGKRAKSGAAAAASAASAASAAVSIAAVGSPSVASASRRRLASQQHQQRQQGYQLGSAVSSSYSGSSSSGPVPLIVYVELEAKHREQLQQVPVISSHVAWIQRVSTAGAALAGQLMQEILTEEYRLQPGSCTTLAVQQLDVEIISSQMVYDDLVGSVTSQHAAGRKGYKGATVVTRTEVDPLTGLVTESQTMRLPVLPDYLPELFPDFPSPAPGDATGSSDSDSSSWTEEDEDEDEGQPQQQPQPQSPPEPTCVEPCSLPNTAVSMCADGVCEVVACAAGWEDCDANPENGCEANVLGFFTDDNHCGSCNKACLAPLTCQLGKCAAKPQKPAPVYTPPAQAPVEQQPAQPPAAAQQQQQQQPSQQGGASTDASKEDKDKQQQQQPAQPQPGKQEPQVTQPGSADAKPPSNETKPTQPEPPTRPSDGNGTSLTPTPQASPAPAGEQVVPQKPQDTQQQQQQQQQNTSTPAVQPPAQPPLPVAPAAPAVSPAPAPKPQPPRPRPVVGPPQPKPVHVALRDDVVRVSPADASVIMDVISNDDLRGASPGAVSLNIVSQPTVGTATVLQPDGRNGRPRLQYTQDSKARIEPGSEVDVFYTVSVPGQPTPAPATVTLLGAAGPSDSSLSNCSASPAALVAGTPVAGLTRADDAAVAVRLPFAVQMYGASYTAATISSNGWVSLGTNTSAREPCNVEGEWPGAACLGTGPVLAPFWDDLVTDQVLTRHDTQLGAFVIQWTNVMAPSSRLPIGTFQTYLWANGTVGYVYRDLYGTEQALGASAVAGIRGPTAKSASHISKLQSKAFEDMGSGSDQHGRWLFSTALDDTSDYTTLLGSHSRFLSPGTALISHPVVTAGPRGSSSPGSFKPWSIASGPSSSIGAAAALPLLVSPIAPARPMLLPLTTPAAAAAAPAAQQQHGQRVVTLSWQLPGDGTHSSVSPTFYKLYLAADPLFNELLRQPASTAFKPDIQASSRSVDVEISGQHAANTQVHALLLACNAAACSRSCIGQYTLS